MDELISKQALIDSIYAQSDDDGYYVATAESLEELINGLPTVPSEIIRCEDCEHDGYCRRLSSRTSDDYCSHAERRIDE